jgi:NAD(P)-dependent dehydrogenase (short-subunit alcohol dehydrogenase family)
VTEPARGRRVVAVTGGGGGIGAAIAEELGRRGAFVVTLDPLVSLDGAEQLPPADDTTAERIVAAGGAARASATSVTDPEAVRALFDELVHEHGRLDAVINVAGITRPTAFTGGTDEDWRAVLEVHLDGYRNVLDAALPIMAAAGRGRILGVTSGSGWRAADTGAYGCAKRAVASLTWQLGVAAPHGVVVNAISPIAVTRMVTAALARSGPQGGRATGGLSLGSMPDPADLGPLGAHLVDEGFGWCSGQVVFAGGSEVAVVDRPRLLEVVRTDGVPSLGHLLEAVTAGALVPAEAQQASTGGSNPRFGAALGASSADGLPPTDARTCVVVSDRAGLAGALTAALEARGVTCTAIPADDVAAGFAGRAGALRAAAGRTTGPVDAVVVALAGPGPARDGSSEWERILAEHRGIVGDVHADAGWARAVADHATSSGRAMRVVTVAEATTAGGRTRGQAAAQLARSARGATADLVTALTVSDEGAGRHDPHALAEVVAHLVASPSAVGLSGAELAAGPRWFGLRSHPRPAGSIVFGGPELPDWFDGALREIVGP